MRNIILSALILASAFQTAFADTFGEWTYTVSNNQATITGYSGAGGALAIPSQVNGIPVVYFGGYYSSVFGWGNTSVTSITIPNSVTSIGYSAFMACTGLTSVTIGTSVTSIGDYAFYGCSGLSSVTIPSSVTSIGYSAFDSCTGLTSVTIPSSVTTIDVDAFKNCNSLTAIAIPNGVTSIRQGTFQYCFSLASVTIPNSVTSIGQGAFQFCRSLTSVTIPSSVVSIGNVAFNGCTLLSSIVLPSNQTTVGENAFDASTAVSYTWTYTVSNNQATISAYTGAGGAVTIPGTLGGFPVVKVGSGWPPVFWQGGAGASITSFIIPDSVTSIGQSAFQGCTGLITLTVPNSVTSIGQDAFNGTGLTSINIPNSVTSIGENAFYQCFGLRSVIIGNGVTSIGRGAFLNCSGLTSVSIGNSVTSIGDLAFLGTLLNSIMLPSTTTIVGANAFPTSTTILYSNQLSALAIDPTFGTALASNSAFVTALANNDAFVAAVANKIKGTMGNYGIATQGLLFNVTDTLATKSELTTGLTESRTAGVNSVLSNPNLWTLYTTSQIQNMAVGDLVLTKSVAGTFTLNYDIEQSTDLVTWTTYQALSLPLSGLPTDKAFVRIKAKQ